TTWDSTIVSGSGETQVVQIFVDGVISEEASWNGSFDFNGLLSQLNQAKDDDAVKAIVLRVNSPGGAVVPTDELHQKIMQIRNETHKPVVVSMGSYAASGGYYISTAADKIYANPSTLTGSLGVIASYLNYGDLAAKYGVKENVIKSGKFKDIGSPMRPMTEDEHAILQTMINESYQQFVDVIAEGRKMPRDKVVKLADGRVYTGKQAKQAGLIDEFGTLEDATNEAMKLANVEDATVIRYEEPLSFGSFLPFMSSAIKQYVPSQPLPDFLREEKRTPSLEYIYRP
ncbi:signal peptide peptidase SppA, partial [Aneurinibacillus tyrosinisolvens]|uniref:signal peptide peptidase SppA n=1 Tax=Aneurinibacillus tyrosinisolvens TaxID=1443435 RepID=UPI00063F9029